jgi:hypothetical protein
MGGSDDLWGEDGDSPAANDELSREWDARRTQFYNVSALVAPHACVRGCYSMSHAAQRPLLAACTACAWIKMRMHHSGCDAAAWIQQSGYREGLDEGKGKYLQQGFNAGVLISTCAWLAPKLGGRILVITGSNRHRWRCNFTEQRTCCRMHPGQRPAVSPTEAGAPYTS